jgi:3-oxosteroid 1-dehydrogenase
VLLATSSYEGNAEYVKHFDHHPDFVSGVPSSITGDHFRLAGRLGARIVQVPQVLNVGYHVTGEEHDGGTPLWRAAIIDTGLPHGIVVNQKGRRFADESFYPALGDAVEIFSASDNEYVNYPCWVIVDSQHVNKYPCGSILPGQEFPEEMAVRGGTIRELAENAGISPDGLAAEVDKINQYSVEGVDHDFGRGSRLWSNAMCGDPKGSPKNPNLGTLREGPFYAIPLKPVGTGICTTGLQADANGSVINWDGVAIPGLYAAGNAVAQLDIGSGYQSGLCIGRGLVFGHLAAAHASGKPSAAVGRSVEFSS